MALVGSYVTATQSALNPTNRYHVNQRTQINDIPAHLLTDHIFSYLTAQDTYNFLSFRFDHIKSILKIWNPRRRLKLLKKALERNDPAFEDNYLLRYAAAKGMKDIVQLLLTYSCVDPRAKNNWALILAKENKHEDVYNLLVQRSPENDIETGLIHYSNSSYDILSDLIHAQPDVAWGAVEQRNDLQLLLDTSTKILPYLEDAIFKALRLGKSELVTMMLFFVAFDHSYFNHIVLIKQLMRGNSFKDIRKINPFLHGNESIFVKAMRGGDLKLVNLILDKGVKSNPFQVFACSQYYSQRQDALCTALRIARRTFSTSDLETVSTGRRLRHILEMQSAYHVIIVYLAVIGFMGSAFYGMKATS